MDFTQSLIMVSFQVILASLTLIVTYWSWRHRWSRERRLKECRQRVVSTLRSGPASAKELIAVSNHKRDVVLETLDKLENEDVVLRKAKSKWSLTKHGHWLYTSHCELADINPEIEELAEVDERVEETAEA